MSFDMFAADQMVIDAVERCLLKITEAAVQLGEETMASWRPTFRCCAAGASKPSGPRSRRLVSRGDAETQRRGRGKRGGAIFHAWGRGRGVQAAALSAWVDSRRAAPV